MTQNNTSRGRTSRLIKAAHTRDNYEQLDWGVVERLSADFEAMYGSEHSNYYRA